MAESPVAAGLSETAQMLMYGRVRDTPGADPEVEAVRLVTEGMERLRCDPDAQARVLRWACDRYGARDV